MKDRQGQEYCGLLPVAEPNQRNDSAATGAGTMLSITGRAEFDTVDVKPPDDYSSDEESSCWTDPDVETNGMGLPIKPRDD